MSDVDLTVLLATRNGGDVLPRTLEAYCHLENPPNRWKLVIVDNGSDDTTWATLASFNERLPLETLQQPIAGKNRALNLGLGAIEGGLAIITDDDAIPDRSLLVAWSRYLAEHQDYQLFGGSIDPLFGASPPKWISKNTARFDLLFATRNLPEGPIAPDEIFGPNMAVRSSVFASGFRFNENIGPNGSDPHYPMGSETEFCSRVAKAGARAWFAKAPRVQHVVRDNQLTSSYWAARAYRHGLGTAQQMWERGETDSVDFSWQVIMNQLSRRLQMFSPFPFQRFSALWDYHWTRGFHDQWATSRKPPPA
jgi:glycosyltransferase involved in cell wall biosynthesis